MIREGHSHYTTFLLINLDWSACLCHTSSRFSLCPRKDEGSSWRTASTFQTHRCEDVTFVDYSKIKEITTFKKSWVFTVQVNYYWGVNSTNRLSLLRLWLRIPGLDSLLKILGTAVSVKYFDFPLKGCFVGSDVIAWMHGHGVRSPMAMSRWKLFPNCHIFLAAFSLVSSQANCSL